MYSLKPFTTALGLILILRDLRSGKLNVEDAINFIHRIYGIEGHDFQLDYDYLKMSLDEALVDIKGHSYIINDVDDAPFPKNFEPYLTELFQKLDSRETHFEINDFKDVQTTIGMISEKPGDLVPLPMVNGYVALGSVLYRRLGEHLAQHNYDAAICCLTKLKIQYFIVSYFEHANYEEVPMMESTIDSAVERLDADLQQTELMLSGMEDFYRNENSFTREIMSVTGNESFVAGVMMCYSYDPTRVAGMEGFVDSVKEGLRKTGEMIMSMLKSIKEFFFGRKKEASEQMADIAKTLKEQLTNLQKEDASKYEVNQENIGKLKKMLEDAKLTEVAGYFSNVSDFGGLLAAYTRAIDKLESEAAKLSEAEKAIQEAERAANEATKEPSNLKEDASSDEKKLIKDQQAEKAASAKEKVNEANEKVKASFMPVKAAAKLKGLFSQLWKKKGEEGSTSTEEKKEVTGNESWMF